MGMIASPENAEFRQKVASYGGLPPLVIAQKLGYDVKRVYEARQYIKDHTQAPQNILERTQFNRKILDKAFDSNKFVVFDGGRKIQKYDIHGSLQPCGIETVAKMFGFISELPAYD